MSEATSIMHVKWFDILNIILDVTPLSMATLVRAHEIRHSPDTSLGRKFDLPWHIYLWKGCGVLG
jgi:hypothetical protein